MRRIVPQATLKILICLCFWNRALGQVIESLSGEVSPSSELKAVQTSLVTPRSAVMASDGSIYISDDGSRTVRRIDSLTNIATVVAGGGSRLDDLFPISAKSAYLSPVGLAVDEANNVYIADQDNHRIRFLTPSGFITTIAGDGTPGYSGDGGLATRSQLDLPLGITRDAIGNLYITDPGSKSIRKVNMTTGIITTLAGGPDARGTQNGILARQSRLNFPWGIAVDPAGNVYFADTEDYVVRRIDAATGLIFTVAGTGSLGSSGDGGPAINASLSYPRGVALAPNGDLFISEYSDAAGKVRKISAATGNITTVLGTRDAFSLAIQSEIIIPGPIGHLSISPQNELLIALEGDNLVGKIPVSGGKFTTLAGNRNDVGDGGPALAAAVARPQKIALDSSGNLYIADFNFHRIRRISPGPGGTGTGTITTVAGNGVAGTSGDGGLATNANIQFPIGICVDSRGNIYFTDNFSRIRRVDATGRVQSIAGSTAGFGGDGKLATTAQLQSPRAVVADTNGNLYIADTGNARIRRVDTNGIIQTIAGNKFQHGYGGDGGPATEATLNQPTDLLLDGRGGLLIADLLNHRVRRIELSSGRIETIAGNGNSVYSGDGGPAILAGLREPRGLALDAQGNLYIAAGNAVRRVDVLTRTITTIAGNDMLGFSGDHGLAVLARLNHPQSVVVDAQGNVIISDSDSNHIRRVVAVSEPPLLSLNSRGLFFQAIEGGASPLAQELEISISNSSERNWIASAKEEDGAGWLRLGRTGGATPTLLPVRVDTTSLKAGSYNGLVAITAPGVSNSPQGVRVSLTVTPAAPSRLKAEPEVLTFRSVRGGLDPVPQFVQIGNLGGGTLDWTARVQTENGVGWLTIANSRGVAPSVISVSALSAGLSDGVHQATIQLLNQSTKETSTVQVICIISQSASTLSLSQSGLTFTAKEGATSTPVQTVQITSSDGEFSWQAKTQVLAGGDWLRIHPGFGRSSSQSSPLTVSASPVGLRPGIYDALITISAAGLANSPQVILVRLSIQEGETTSMAAIDPGGLALVAPPGGAAQLRFLTLSTSGGSSINFVTSATTEAGGNWLSVSPPGGTLLGSAERASIAIQADPSRLSAGAYQGTVHFGISTGGILKVPVLMIVSAASSTRNPDLIATQSNSRSEVDLCVPRTQFPVTTSVVENLSHPTGWPNTLTVQVLNNCGDPVLRSSVIATLSNGEPAISLSAVGSGIYSGPWRPPTIRPATVTLMASGSGLEAGTAQFVVGTSPGSSTANARVPAIFPNGIVNAASYKKFSPSAPGQITALFGENFSTVASVAQTTPLPSNLSGVSAQIGGLDVPLFYSDSGQINIQIPNELAAGNTLPLIVKAGVLASVPEPVTISSNQPGIFTQSSSGGGLGIVTDASGKLIDTSNPARSGQVVVIFTTGLGSTIPTVPSGRGAPSDPPAQLVDGPSVLIGSLPARVLFAGLTPNFVGLYQINVEIPAGTAPDPAVPLVVIQNGVTSNSVTIPIE